MHAAADLTGELVVEMLSKKLERMAARQQRRELAQQKQQEARTAGDVVGSTSLEVLHPREGSDQRPGRVPVNPPPSPRISIPTTNTAPPGVSGAASALTSEASAIEGHGEHALYEPYIDQESYVVHQGQEERYDGIKVAELVIEEEEGRGGGVRQKLRALLRDPQIAAFFLLATLLGLGHGVIGTFLFVYLADLGGGPALMGWVLMANALPELPVFYYFGNILHVVGMNTLILSAAFCLALRIAAFTLLPFVSIWWVLPLETVHAITYAAGWSACAINVSKVAPSGLESTMQGVFQGLWTGVGAGLGSLLGGIMYHTMGPQVLFLSSAGVIGIGTACAACVFWSLRSTRKRSEAL